MGGTGSGEIFGYLRFPLINTLDIDFPQPFESGGSVGGKQSTDAETVGQNSETHLLMEMQRYCFWYLRKNIYLHLLCVLLLLTLPPMDHETFGAIHPHCILSNGGCKCPNKTQVSVRGPILFHQTIPVCHQTLQLVMIDTWTDWTLAPEEKLTSDRQKFFSRRVGIFILFKICDCS